MSVTQVDHVARLQAQMAAITKPLSDHYAEVDKTIKELEAELVQLRKARTQLKSTLRSIDPELVPTNGKKKPQTAGPNPSSAEALANLTTWLQEHRDEINAQGGIHASGIINSHGKIVRDDYDGKAMLISNQSKLSQAFRTLHDQGVVRLDHTGNGGAKYYTVV